MKQLSFRTSKVPLVSLFSVLLLGAAIAGCGNLAVAQGVASAGFESAATLAAYYESLIQDTLDVMDIEVFLTGNPSAEGRREQLAQIDALNRRVLMARRLGLVYDALRKLTSPGPAKDVQAAAENLGAALTQIPQLAGTKVDIKETLGTIASRIATFKQSRDARAAISLMAETIDGIAGVFAGETDVYKSISAQRDSDVRGLIARLIQLDKDNKETKVFWPLLPGLADVLNITLPSSEEALRDPEKRIQLAQARVVRLTLLSNGATDSMALTLTSLADVHKAFAAGRGANPGTVLVWQRQAKTYLDEIAKLRSARPK